MMNGDRDSRVRERAYALWEQEGRPDGRHEEHWRQASQDLGPESGSQAGGSSGDGSPESAGGGQHPSEPGSQQQADSRPEAAGGEGMIEASEAIEAATTAPRRRQQA